MKRSIALALFALVLPLMGCNGKAGSSSTASGSGEDSITITDLLDRDVEVLPGSYKRIVCIGAGALRLYSYIGDPTLICGVERIEVEAGTSGSSGFGFLDSPYAIRPYNKVFGHYWNDLPSCGQGGPKAQIVETEQIALCEPDLIISLYTSEAAAMDTLQETLKVPVITLSYGDKEAFDENVIESLEILGTLLDREERAKELVDYINGMAIDLAERAEGIAHEEKPSVYLGCQAKYGLKSFASSSAQYSIFDAAGVRNYLDDLGLSGYQSSVDLSYLVAESPDKIILDASGLQTLKSEFDGAEETREVIESIKAIQDNEVYIQMPYNSYYTNLEIAYCDAYYAGSICFPERYSDVDIAEKANEITKMFLAVEFYESPSRNDDISDTLFGGYQKLTTNLFEFLNEIFA